jgi:beta-lactamase superfamily II metal-dependent hydrolase
MRNLVKSLQISLLAFSLLALAIPDVSGQNLEIHCIDVDQGDCTLILSPTGKTILVDAGYHYYADEIDLYLDNLGIGYFNYIVATHYHADHIGAISKLLDDYGYVLLDSVYDRGWEYCTATYEDYYEPAVRDRRATITDGEVIDLGGGTLVRCCGLNGKGKLSPPYIDRDCPGGGDDDENDFSIALVVSHNNFDFFVAGDLSGYNTTYYSNIEDTVGVAAGDVEVYQVNHHGSRYSSNPTFLSLIDPEVSVISVGEGNPYGHPDPEALQRLQATSEVYRTDWDGDVVIITDGVGGYTVNGDYYEILLPPESLSVVLTPHNPRIQIPSAGGSFLFDASITNNTAHSKRVAAWTEAILPNGQPYGPIQLVHLNVGAGQTRNFANIRQNVPGGAPAGDYLFLGKVGESHQVAADSSSFPFTKLSGTLGLSPLGEWWASEWFGVETGLPTGTDFNVTVSPNPFNDQTSIAYSLIAPGEVKLELYDLAGRRVTTILDSYQSTGTHRLIWKGENASGDPVSTGVYFLSVKAGELNTVRKVILLR